MLFRKAQLSSNGAELVLMLQLVYLWTLSGASKGQDFYLAYMERKDYYSGDNVLSLFLSNPNPTPVQAEINFKGIPDSPITQTIGAGDTFSVVVPRDLILVGSEKHNKCLHITSDDAIYIQSSNDLQQPGTADVADGFSVLPTSALSTEYIAATHCYINRCVFVVTSIEDGNNIEIKFRIDSPSGEEATYLTGSYSDDDVLTESLNTGESMQVICVTCDMTGTLVTATKRVAVFSGGKFTRLSAIRIGADSLAEQMVPTHTLGSRYVLGSNYVNPSLQEIVKVVCLNAGTTFIMGGSSVTATKDREVTIIDNDMQSVVEIIGNGLMLVVEIIASVSDDRTPPDVSMILAVPANSWKTSYTVPIPEPLVSDGSESLFMCLISPNTNQANWMEIVSGGLAIDRTTTAYGTYILMTLEFNTGGLRQVECTDSACQPFWAFVLHNKPYRTSAFSVLDLPYVAPQSPRTNPATTAPNDFCSCNCVMKEVANTTMTEEEHDKIVEEVKATIEKELLEDRKTISSYVRSKTSAPDERQSSRLIGTSVGIVVSVIVATIILGSDMISFVRFLADKCRHWKAKGR